VSGDWDAATYHVVSAPQQEWGRRVLDRLALDGSESVADVGCGTGHLTAELLTRVPRGRLTAIDRSPAMLSQARRHLPSDRVAWVRASADALPFSSAFDVIFSTATFHWVLDHDTLFSSLFEALKPGGRLHAQCGGGPNLARLRRRAAHLVAQPPFAAHFQGWQEPWQYADPAATESRLRVAGFRNISTSLEQAPVRFEGSAEFRTFCENVCLHPYLNRLPIDTRASFGDELVKLAESDDPPFVLDYWRLNLAARKPDDHGRA
jgi:trans-aconitate methyltransferase